MRRPMDTSPASPTLSALAVALRDCGHQFLQGPHMRALLTTSGSLDDLPAFQDSWGRLELDLYMADGGRYRRRRHAVFAAGAQGTIERLAAQPHYQGLEYNRLNGGIARWFEPVEPGVAAGACMQTLLHFCRDLFSSLAPEVQRWHIEAHQFRIEARADMAGQPTPEGVHRDGVDYVLVLLVRRHNIASGTTTIHQPDATPLGSFTLTQPLDAALIDDRRVYHGVTAVQPVVADQPAYRDVLVLTFRRES